MPIFFETLTINFYYRTGTVWPQVRTTKLFTSFFSNPDHRMSLSPLVFASLADRLILRVAEKIEVFFLLRN